MALRYLLDTNAASEPYKLTASASFMRRLAKHEGQVALSAPTWYELQRGLECLPAGRRKQALRESFLALRARLPILPYEARAAEWHGREEARLRARGKTPPPLDGQIAAVAWVNDLTLVTANLKDFRAFDGLVLERW